MRKDVKSEKQMSLLPKDKCCQQTEQTNLCIVRSLSHQISPKNHKGHEIVYGGEVAST